jgi:hypothetical protein
VGQAVSVAVGRFVAVGEAIATENQELKEEMGQACFEARRAGRGCLGVCVMSLCRITLNVGLYIFNKSSLWKCTILKTHNVYPPVLNSHIFYYYLFIFRIVSLIEFKLKVQSVGFSII